MAEVLKTLIAAPERINPAIVMQRRLADASPGIAELLALKPEIEQAIQLGEKCLAESKSAFKALIASDAVPSAHVPEGF